MGLLGPSMLGRGAGGLQLTYLDYKTGGATLTGFNFGLPAATRLMIAAVCYAETGSGSSAITNVVIGGVTATRVAQSPAANNQQMILAYAVVPTGTSGTVAIAAGSGSAFAVMLYSLAGYTATAPTDTYSINTAGASNLNAVLDLPRASVAIYGLITGSGAAVSFPSATIDDTQLPPGMGRVTVAHKLNGPNVITADSENFTFGSGRAAAACAVWN